MKTAFAAITTKLVMMTPEIAASLLNKNHGNRRIRPTRVKEFVSIIKAQEWKTTHQGVAMDEEGTLIDGQHRLQAIKDSGVSLPILLTEGLELDAKTVIDTHTKRSVADLMSIDKHVLSPVIELARVRYGLGTVRPAQVSTLLPVFLPISEKLYEAVRMRPKRTLGSSAVKAAAILRISHGEDAGYVFGVYNAMASMDASMMPPVAQSFLRQIVEGTIGYKYVAIVKAWVVFGYENRDLQKLGFKNLTRRMDEIRDLIKDKETK